jgi:hypothetical protein
MKMDLRIKAHTIMSWMTLRKMSGNCNKIVGKKQFDNEETKLCQHNY